jgi:hypothetical protein
VPAHQGPRPIVLRLGPDQGGAGGQGLAIALVVVRVRDPQRIQGLIGQRLIEGVEFRAA